jgi:hypothetical protein
MTPPSGPARQVLIVPIVTEHEKSDLTCRLDSGDHPFLKRPSVVEYRRARIEFATRLEACIASGEFVRMETMNAALFERVRSGFHASRYSKPFARSFLDDHAS